MNRFSIASGIVWPWNISNHRRILLGLVSLVIFIVAWIQYDQASPRTENGILPTSPPSPYLRFHPNADPIAKVILIHGLNGNKQFMQPFGMALAEAGFEAYAFDLPGHGDSSTSFTFDLSSLMVESIIGHVGVESFIVGHSLGAGLLIDLAPTQPLGKVVLLSPAPVPLEPLNIESGLIITGGFDAPMVNEFAAMVLEATGQAGVWWKFPYATHSSPLLLPSKMEMIANWLGGSGKNIRAATRYAWLVLMATAGLLGGLALLPKGPQIRSSIAKSDPGTLLVSYGAAAAGAIIVLWLFIPLAWLHIFATDYLMSFVFLTGIPLIRYRHFRISRRGILASFAASIYVIFVFGIGIGNHLFHLIPSGDQWFRLPVLAAASFPLFLADEQLVRDGLQGSRRLLVIMSTRLTLWAAIMTGVLLINKSAIFLVLITHFIIIFWIFLWFMAGFIYRATEEPAAAAMFAALVQAWVFSAVFVAV